MKGWSFKKFLPLISGGILILLADQVTKEMIRNSLSVGERIPVIDGLFNIVFIWNRGSAFSFLSGVESNWVPLFLKVASVVALALVVSLYNEFEHEGWMIKYSFILIFGGAIGNMVDRFAFGMVTDFLDVYVGTHHWPAFNVADSCITIGLVLMLLHWGRQYMKGEGLFKPEPDKD
jgi:signal peptidase II